MKKLILMLVTLILFSCIANAVVLLDEDFDDGVADNWGITLGTWSLSSGTYNADQTVDMGTGQYLAISDYGLGSAWTDYTAEARVRGNDSVSNYGSYDLWFRSNLGTFQGYFVDIFIYDGASQDSVVIYRADGASATPLNTFSGNFLDMDTWYDVKVVVQGINMGLYIDGNLIIGATDATYGAGTFALGLSGAGTLGSFDDVLVYNSNTITVLEPTWDPGYDLYDTQGNSIDVSTSETILQIKENGNVQVEFEAIDNVDISGLTIDADSERVVVDFGASTGVSVEHSLLLPNNGGGVYVCPNAISLNDVGISCTDIGTFSDAECQSGTPKTIGGDTVTCKIDGSYYKISGLTGSGVGSACDQCSDCDAGLFCDLRDGTPTCKTTDGTTPGCIDCLDNDADTYTDYAGLDGIQGNSDDDQGCSSFDDDSESDGPPPSPGEIPEFSTIGIILTLAIALLGIALIIMKRK